MQYDSVTMIAAILGAFFVLVALFKSLGRGGGAKGVLPGSPADRSDRGEVKLSDPFTAPKGDVAAKAKTPPAFVADALTEESGETPGGPSMIKQFSPGAPLQEEARVKDDNDYHWE